jgi:hypothetical protein
MRPWRNRDCDSVVQAYLTRDDPATRALGSLGARHRARSQLQRDLDRNRAALREIQGELASRTYRLTEARILDLLIWSLLAAT